MENSPILAVRDLVKNYRGGVRAVDGLSFEIRRGICFGLLGPNGAGKTTTIEMMEGILAPTSGEILYKGSPIGASFRNEIGIQFQQTAIQDYLSVREVLELFRSFYSRSLPLEQLIDSCNLGEFLDRVPKKLSGGQRQRVLLALALVNDPEIVFLDEPTTGLDPQARRNFWDLVNGIKARGKTLVLTTHYMDEAQVLCDEIAIVDRGRLIERGAPADLLRTHFGGAVIELPPGAIDEALLAGLEGPDGLGARVARRGERWEIESASVNATIAELIRRGISLEGLLVKSPTLEDLFLKMTGKHLRG